MITEAGRAPGAGGGWSGAARSFSGIVRLVPALLLCLALLAGVAPPAGSAAG